MASFQSSTKSIRNPDAGEDTRPINRPASIEIRTVSKSPHQRCLRLKSPAAFRSSAETARRSLRGRTALGSNLPSAKFLPSQWGPRLRLPDRSPQIALRLRMELTKNFASAWEKPALANRSREFDAAKTVTKICRPAVSVPEQSSTN